MESLLRIAPGRNKLNSFSVNLWNLRDMKRNTSRQQYTRLFRRELLDGGISVVLLLQHVPAHKRLLRLARNVFYDKILRSY